MLSRVVAHSGRFEHRTMLTRLQVRNLKRFDEIDIELGKSVVLVGPNNSGKTTALQALALWDIGLRRWNEKRQGRKSPEKRSGVTINRRDLISIPVPNARLLWRDLHVRNVESVRVDGKATTKTQNVRVDVIVEGISHGREWSCGLEFDYANDESIYCRPLSTSDATGRSRMTIPEEAASVGLAYLPPMSGLGAVEPKWEPGRINVLIGEGQTAQVLRNLCYQIHLMGDGDRWARMCGHIAHLFGVKLLPPEFIAERGEITMSYEDRDGPRLDLSSSGRGLQQTLLLLAHLYANPRTVLLLDEPDAHLEILRQRQIYSLLTGVAGEQGSQIIAASHSEVILNEAAGRDIVIAFVGKPHRMNDRPSQVVKALSSIGWEHYYQAKEMGWILYLENSTDLAILQSFARALDHPAAKHLERPFVHYVGTNLPQKSRDHFYGLREAKTDLIGLAIFDRLDKELQTESPLVETMWQRREIENYFCTESVLLAYAAYDRPDPLFDWREKIQREACMRESIAEVQEALRVYRDDEAWSPDIKATDDFLDPLFRAYFKRLGLQLSFRKSNYHELAELVPKDELDPEVTEKLDMIVAVAKQAKPEETE